MQPLSRIATQAGHQRVTVAALFAAYLGSFGVFLPFFPIWLDGQGFSSSWIAGLVAVPLLVRVLTTSFVTDAAERFDDPRLPMRVLSLATALVFAVLPLSLVLAPSSVFVTSPWGLLVIVALMAVGWNALLPLSDALGIQLSRQTGADYGRIRVWGSVAFIAVSFASGALIERFGTQAIPWLILLTLLCLAGVCAALPSSFVHKPSDARSLQKQQSKRSGWLFFLRRKGAMTVFIGAGLMQASHAVLYGFGSLSWANQGFSETSIGLLWSFGVFCEIVLFAISAPIVAKIGARGLLIIGGLGALVRWIAFAWTPDFALTFGLQILHACSFGMTHLALIAYVQRRARPRELRAAQGVYGVISGALMAVATLAAGPLYAALGAGAYAAMAVMTGVGVLIVFIDRVRIPGGHIKQQRLKPETP